MRSIGRARPSVVERSPAAELTLIGAARFPRKRQHRLGKFLVGEVHRGVLQRDLSAKFGAALAVAAPAKLVELRLRFGEPFARARPCPLELLPPRREQARVRLVARAELLAGERSYA